MYSRTRVTRTLLRFAVLALVACSLSSHAGQNAAPLNSALVLTVNLVGGGGAHP